MSISDLHGSVGEVAMDKLDCGGRGLWKPPAKPTADGNTSGCDFKAMQMELHMQREESH